jgi:outer membrane protein assembly factor BamB
MPQNQSRRIGACLVALVVALGRQQVVGDDWPNWRGPCGNNHSAAVGPPTEWSPRSGVVWSTEVPGLGHASPCVCGDKIFLASADEELGAQFLLCYRRATGELDWRTELQRGKLPSIHANNSHASATPACDGDTVFVPLVGDDELWLTAVSITGKVRWGQRIGAFRHANGYGSSPVLYGDYVIVSSDNQADPCLVALARIDGREVWRVKRPLSDNSATPIIGRVAQRDQLLINGARSTNSYDPATGREIWHVSHECEVVANTMTFDQDKVYASGNVPQKLVIAIRADGSGDVTNTHVLWQVNQANPYVTSPLIVDDRLLTVLDNGAVVCREPLTGKVLWKRRLGGNFFSSPVLAAGYVYAVSELGVVHVFEAGEKFKEIAANDLAEVCMATPAICDHSIYLRTTSHLLCIRAGGEPLFPATTSRSTDDLAK